MNKKPLAGLNHYRPLLGLYDAAWRVCMPLLRLNPRLKTGFYARKFMERHGPADLWIQAASAGEAYLACSLLSHLKPCEPLSILITTNTQQGFDILRQGIDDLLVNNKGIRARVSFFPFDRPAIMERAMETVQPRAVVMLETELWPGLFTAVKKYNRRLLIVNGRLTEKSLKRYLLLASFWKAAAPDKVLAISKADADRFGRLFGRERVETMPNIKFDRLNTMPESLENPLKPFFPKTENFLVLGSVRQEEEKSIENIIKDVLSKLPKTIIGLFPRHMHRIPCWANALEKMKINWDYRSKLNNAPVPEGSVVLWDGFGELTLAYALANAVFVGGSLAPLGGQNFLEPLMCGVSPVIGPSWENFAWVGDHAIRNGLVCKADTWQEVSMELIKRLIHPQPREQVRSAALDYIRSRMGGTAQACRAITAALEESSPVNRGHQK